MPVLVDPAPSAPKAGATVRVKICGLTRPEDVAAVAASGAAYMGLVFFPKSPRNISIDTARALALEAPPGLAKVALLVNPGDALLDAVHDQVPLDMIQLHGQETPARVAEIRARTGLPVMKAVGIADAEDLAQLDAYAKVADQLLVDAKPPKHADLPGGNGLAFDWRLLAGYRWSKPWMLAGGLTPENVAEAIRLTGATQVDVSSGVESAPGRKAPDTIRAFVSAATAPRPPRL
ncbi:phosphoribosylanthranilate isomerase [Pseudooceanicola sp. CBS1P-1]|uniref:N-(5'-phosphoribosyl)anthranilate isomerase n=1 Tax=Pseudooceanicola albus TaxID=2692189 RepID=A0A6L7G2F5_9RHOB|nr:MULTISPECIES: phosphoribosylanthranilate isomerase [Pseudooceanicola]MBT9384563.1 phosphoribosylanthranilate isomerase [Pseudooceanicola endophyticus]MXN18265.1 phosphoribosylanthranilate isomerase [Pseudooceanicola albus]